MSPQNTIITFDIHGVLFNPDHRKIVRLAWRNKSAFLIGFYFFNPKFAYQVLSLKLKGAVPEEYFMRLTHAYPSLEKYKKLAIDISNAQIPQGEIVRMVQKLKNLGYTLHLFSNIGDTIAKDLSASYPEIFALFDQLHVPGAHNNYTGKRQPGGFALYQATCNPEKKQVILIDDNKQNMARAAQVGITGIYFKNTGQLLTELQRLQIC
jgi:FMN phosphatase YigB (HAD superfamily)